MKYINDVMTYEQAMNEGTLGSDSHFFNIYEAVKLLKEGENGRFIFHSEADFQFQLAWKIKEIEKENAEVFLEYPFGEDKDRIYVDIVVKKGNKLIPIELKYKTKKLNAELRDIKFNLQNQSAANNARYDYCSDIERVESLRNEKEFEEGYVIMLTNDANYLSNEKDNYHKDFYIGHNMIKSGTLERSDERTTDRGKREKPIVLKGSYELNWYIFGDINSDAENKIKSKNSGFYILITKLKKEN